MNGKSDAEKQMRMRIERFELVSAFRRDDTILLTCGHRLKAVQESVGGKIIQLSVSDRAPPELPRAIIKADGVRLQVGLNRFHLVVEPPSHVANNYAESWSYARSNSEQYLSTLLEGNQEYEWTGVVASIEFAEIPMVSSTAIQAIAPVYKRLVTLDWPSRDLASFNLQIGRAIAGYFRTYTISGYEIKAATVQVPAGERPMRVDMSKVPPSQVGIQLFLDVNNKPHLQKTGPIDDLYATMTEHQSAFEQLAPDLHLDGILP